MQNTHYIHLGVLWWVAKNKVGGVDLFIFYWDKFKIFGDVQV